MRSMAAWFGIDRRLAWLWLWIVVLSSLFYSVYMLFFDKPFDGDGGRLVEGLFYMMSIAAVYSPIGVPLLLVGWSVAWVLGGTIRLPPIVRSVVAATVAGAAVAVPFATAYWSGGYAAENTWKYVSAPALMIVPLVAMLSALGIYWRKSPPA